MSLDHTMGIAHAKNIATAVHLKNNAVRLFILCCHSFCIDFVDLKNFLYSSIWNFKCFGWSNALMMEKPIHLFGNICLLGISCQNKTMFQHTIPGLKGRGFTVHFDNFYGFSLVLFDRFLVRRYQSRHRTLLPLQVPCCSTNP